LYARLFSVYLFTLLITAACTKGIGRLDGDGDATPEFQYTFEPVENVSCQEPFLVSTSPPHSFDRIFPSRSVKTDVLDILGEPDDEEEWDGISYWIYELENDNGSYTVGWRGDDLFYRSEPRQRLDEIVARYGVPTEIYWRLPLFYYDESTPRTYLLYREQGTLFIVEDQIVEFATDTQFDESYVIAPDQYQRFLASRGIFNEKWAEYEEYIEVKWPCRDAVTRPPTSE
jgi:hypothetical protein